MKLIGIITASVLGFVGAGLMMLGEWIAETCDG